MSPSATTQRATRRQTDGPDADPPTRRADPTRRGGGRTWGSTPAVTMPVQRLPQVSTPDDPLEVEAGRVARQVAGDDHAGARPSAAPGGHSADTTVGAWLQRVAVGEEEDERVQRVVVGEEEQAPVATHGDRSVRTVVQRLGEAAPGVTPRTAATIRSPGAGSALPRSARNAIEPKLGVGLSGVRVHSGPAAHRAAASLQARAFTHGSDIFLGRGESSADVGLMAHEATHVVQQGAADTGVVRARSSAGRRSAGVDGVIHRIPGGAWLNTYAQQVPGYELLTAVVGWNPLTNEEVEASPDELVGGLLRRVSGGEMVYDAIQDFDLAHDALAFAERQLRATGELSRKTFDQAVDAALEAVTAPWNAPEIIEREISKLLARVEEFAGELKTELIDLIEEAAADFAEEHLVGGTAWDLVTKVLGRDPLRDEPVDAPTAEIIADFLTLLGEEQLLQQMRAKGTLSKTADWLDQQLETFQGLLGDLQELLGDAWEALQPEELPNLASNIEQLVDRAVELVAGIVDFAATVADKVLDLIKDVVLKRLDAYLDDVPGFDLLTVVLSYNPVTGEEVPRTPQNLIRGFLTLLPGGAAAYQRLAETGVIGQAAARIEAAMADLGISREMVTNLFHGIWDSLTIDDLVDPVGAFVRIRNRFGEPLERLFAFVRVVVEEVLTVVLEAMNFPTGLIGNIITNAMAAYGAIRRDLLGFLLNMLAAVKAGFSRFFSNIGEHLLGGITDFLFRHLREAGIEPPSELTLQSGLAFVLEVLGLSRERLWEKLAERIGEDRAERIRGAIDRLTGIWTFVRDVQQRGLAAIWEYVKGQIAGLWDTIFEQIRSWIMEKVVARVSAKLLSMLDPTGVMAVVNGFIALFNAVQSAIEYAREMLAIVDRYVATMAAVARGDIEPGAARLEQGLASSIPVAIGFLAKQVGLGNLGERISEIVAGLRAKVDQALDWLLDQAERALASVLRKIGVGGAEEQTEVEERTGDVRDIVRSQLKTALSQARSLAEIRSILDAQLREHEEEGLDKLFLSQRREDGSFVIVAEASPAEDLLKLIPRVGEGAKAAVRTLARINLEGGAPAFEEERVEVEVTPSRSELNEYVRTNFGTTDDPDQFLAWREEARARLTTTTTVSVPAGAGVDAAAEVLQTRARQVRGARVEGRRYRLVRRVEEAEHGRSESGGAVFESGSNVIDAQFWSVGSLAEGRRGDNSTHAEVQFIQWFRSLDASVRRRVSRIRIQNDAFSPCWTCSRDLAGFIEDAQQTAGQPIDAVLSWDELYLSPPTPRSGGETTPASLDVLEQAGWTLHGPSDFPVVHDERFVWGRS